MRTIQNIPEGDDYWNQVPSTLSWCGILTESFTVFRAIRFGLGGVLFDHPIPQYAHVLGSGLL